MSEPKIKRDSIRPHSLLGWVWLLFASAFLVLTVFSAGSLAATEPVNLKGFFYLVTYSLFSFLLLIMYKIFYLKQESLAGCIVALVITIFMGICMYVTNSI